MEFELKVPRETGIFSKYPVSAKIGINHLTFGVGPNRLAFQLSKYYTRAKLDNKCNPAAANHSQMSLLLPRMEMQLNQYQLCATLDSKCT